MQVSDHDQPERTDNSTKMDLEAETRKEEAINEEEEEDTKIFANAFKIIANAFKR